LNQRAESQETEVIIGVSSKARVKLRKSPSSFGRPAKSVKCGYFINIRSALGQEVMSIVTDCRLLQTVVNRYLLSMIQTMRITVSIKLNFGDIISDLRHYTVTHAHKHQQFCYLTSVSKTANYWYISHSRTRCDDLNLTNINGHSSGNLNDDVSERW